MKSYKYILTVLMVSFFITGCGIQSIPQAKNKTEETVAEITNQYKRRADLIPNLIKTVKGFADHEKETLDSVVSARARATNMSINAKDINPEQIKEYQAAQGELSQALGRLMMLTENYPSLKSDQNFRDLQAQLEGTENRITHARRNHIEAIRKFNDLVTVFPTSLTNKLVFHYEKMSQWDIPDSEKEQVEKTPEVQF